MGRLIQSAHGNRDVSAGPLPGDTICSIKSRRDSAFESKVGDGFYDPADTSPLPVTRVDAANLIRVLRQLEVMAKRQPPRIAFKSKGRILFVDLAEIMAVQAEGNYVSLRHRPNPYLLRESLSSMAEKLKPYGFIRIHRSVVVNIAGRGDPTFTYGRVQAACRRWDRILSNAHIQRQPQRPGSTMGGLRGPLQLIGSSVRVRFKTDCQKRLKNTSCLE
jgi:hypothetical protein